MLKFEKIKDDNNTKDNIKNIIKVAFNLDLEVSGSWGYTQDKATIILDKKENINGVELSLATIRANLEMNMTLSEELRYASINLKEISREIINEGDKTYHKVLYEIEAMKESDYKIFIQEYKDNYKVLDFDLEGHFKRRKLATIKREIVYFFEISL